MKVTLRVRYKQGENPIPFMPINVFEEQLFGRGIKYKLLKTSESTTYVFYELLIPKQGIYNIRQLRKAINYGIKHYRYKISYIDPKILRQWESDDRNNIR